MDVWFTTGKARTISEQTCSVKLKAKPEIVTLDAGDWVFGGEVEYMDIDNDSQSCAFDQLDASKVRMEHMKLSEWEEAQHTDSKYDIVNGMLYSTRKP